MSVQETVDDIKNTLRPYASYESSLDDKTSPPLTFVYSLFSILCVLISEEFDAVLVAYVEGDPLPLTKLFPPETGLDAVWREAENIASLARHEWERASRYEGLKSVRTLTTHEMKLILQERGVLPQTLPAWKKAIKSHTLSRITWGNLLLSIDPNTPPELAGKKVEAILREFQAQQSQENTESWDNEIKAGIVDKTFAVRFAEHERLRFDFKRAFMGNKKTRGEGTTFEVWLRRLEIYDLSRRGLTPIEISKKTPYFKNDTAENAASKISQDKAQARAYIDAVLSGVPISAVPNVHARR